MDSFHHNIMSDAWQASTDDLLENIFSLDQGSFDFLDASMPDFNLCTNNTLQPEGLSSSSSDSGVSTDQTEFNNFRHS
ncbi:unnamed protein product [Leptidea sinapis]|uniref:Uncharacterized protein n=1 Tax=Leptidea sinapis TaxID=189913 RepID=A0A5E4QWG4_9NEOP|nr:unnamed protein product [Leptidea sinapis]